MRVKSLQLIGFKSFANKTAVHFEPGVTAIVGPNGSGKSNLVDAIRWVLGEHNPRDVRAPRLEDVIFNGTDQKAPLSMAEVSLSIDNQQGLLPISFTEVAVTRRVYRSGESEYLINQSPCRLKDIQELFLGTGLGGGTYAIIEQGHIDMILSSKPEERRVVFEEASGVAKYLAKKHETMRRLDEVEEHLLRIADIIGEVRRQVGALERAANKARQYQSQWDQLKQLEMRLAVDELTSGQERVQALEAQVQALQAQREQLDAQKQAHVTSLEACNAVVSATQQRLQELRTQVVACASQIEQHESQRALKTRWVEELAQQARHLELEDTALQERLGQLDEQVARAAGGEGELRAQAAKLEEELGASAAELSRVEAAAEEGLRLIAAAKAELFDAASTASQQRNRVTDCAAKLQSVESRLARLEEQRAGSETKAGELRTRGAALEQEHAALNAQRETAQAQLAAAQQSLDQASAQRHELTGRLHQLRDELAGQRAQAALQEELWRRHEGFPDAVRQLLAASIPGVVGPLADLVQPAPGYEAVVEAALGPLSEALVVQDRQALVRCREHLAAQYVESCRFIVLADCPPSARMDEEAGRLEGVSGAVRQFVRAEPQHEPLINWILNDSWVIDDIQRLLRLDGALPSRLVSTAGDRWDRRSWRFGAARTSTAGRIGRRQRWEQAQLRLQALEQEFRLVEAHAKEAEERWQLVVAEQEAARGQAAHLAPGIAKLEAQLTQSAHELRRMDDEARERALEAQDLAAQRHELQAVQAEARAMVASAEQQQQAAEQQLAQRQAAQEAAAAARQQALIARAQLETARQSVAERLQSIEARQQELHADQVAAGEQAEAKRAQRQAVVARAQDLERQLGEHGEARPRLREERAHLEAEAETVSCSLQEEEAKRASVVPQLLEAEQQLSALQRRLEEQSQQLSERGFRRAHILQRLRELYQIDEATLQAELQAAPAALTDEQRATMAEQVQKLRGKLEGMGPVSLGSVEEYDELKRRLEFLQRQQQDLVQSRDDLKASITQINRTARTQFRETFDRIRQEFQHYYGRLFDGGEANLLLMDEEDVLECGIDIVARPPGKRLQSISLLSGGERALTAVALLFALFKVRPSPFCILDEIDAPLDEANIDRFTRVLEEFLSLSQFILVTHNKKTITQADSIYGVTMEEPGISKILSAKFAAPSVAAAPTAPVAA